MIPYSLEFPRILKCLLCLNDASKNCNKKGRAEITGVDSLILEMIM